MEELRVPVLIRAAVAILSRGVMFGCTDPVQVFVTRYCEDDQLSILSPCSAVLGVSQYGHCNFIALATCSPHASLQHA